MQQLDKPIEEMTQEEINSFVDPICREMYLEILAILREDGPTENAGQAAAPDDRSNQGPLG